jgi:hypothetical protein
MRRLLFPWGKTIVIIHIISILAKQIYYSSYRIHLINMEREYAEFFPLP